MRRRTLLGLGWVLAAASMVVGPTWGADPEEAARSMIRRVVTAPEVTSRVILERSDPFGGPPNRERGQIWYLPGRGFRFRSDKKNGKDLVIDRERGSFMLYAPAEHVVYKAPFERAPVKLRRLIVEPDRLLTQDLHSTLTSRSIHGVSRPGYQLRSASLGDSLREVTTWIGADPKTGLPRWIAIDSDADSVLVEFEDLNIRSTAKPGDLTLSVPKGTPEESLDPNDLLGEGSRGEPR